MKKLTLARMASISIKVKHLLCAWEGYDGTQLDMIRNYRRKLFVMDDTISLVRPTTQTCTKN